METDVIYIGEKTIILSHHNFVATVKVMKNNEFFSATHSNHAAFIKCLRDLNEAGALTFLEYLGILYANNSDLTLTLLVPYLNWPKKEESFAHIHSRIGVLLDSGIFVSFKQVIVGDKVHPEITYTHSSIGGASRSTSFTIDFDTSLRNSLSIIPKDDARELCYRLFSFFRKFFPLQLAEKTQTDIPPLPIIPEDMTFERESCLSQKEAEIMFETIELGAQEVAELKEYKDLYFKEADRRAAAESVVAYYEEYVKRLSIPRKQV